eukprot:3377932-Pleurochrysis_carterae.AAC.2
MRSRAKRTSAPSSRKLAVASRMLSAACSNVRPCPTTQMARLLASDTIVSPLEKLPRLDAPRDACFATASRPLSCTPCLCAEGAAATRLICGSSAGSCSTLAPARAMAETTRACLHAGCAGCHSGAPAPPHERIEKCCVILAKAGSAARLSTTIRSAPVPTPIHMVGPSAVNL